MKAYLDASVLVALFTNDALTSRAEDLLRKGLPTLAVSDFAAAEFASAVARRVRTAELLADEAWQAFSTFDVWTARTVVRIETVHADVRAAEAFLRRLDVGVRTPDALNIAIVQRTGCNLITFDRKMAAAAQALGLAVAMA